MLILSLRLTDRNCHSNGDRVANALQSKIIHDFTLFKLTLDITIRQFKNDGCKEKTTINDIRLITGVNLPEKVII
jgi:hypothetical protein